MKTIKIIPVLLLVIFTAFLVNAQPKDKGRMFDKLNLSDQQKDKIEILKSDHQKRMIDLKANVEKAAADLHSLQIKGNYSRNDFLAAVDKVVKARTEVAKEMANHRMDVYELLNNDQKKTFDKMPLMGRREGMGRGHGHKGMRNGMGMGMGNGEGMGPGNCPCCDM